MKRFILLVLAGALSILGTAEARAQSGYSTLYSFAGQPSGDGAEPWGGLTPGGGFLYGTTSAGGNDGRGTVFSLRRDGTGYTILREFSNQTGDGAGPCGSLVLRESRIYGTTNSGGNNHDGTVFSLETDGGDYTILHSFTFSADDGAKPIAGLVSDGSRLFGTTYYGGSNYFGTVFTMDFNGSSNALLHDFPAFAEDGLLLYATAMISGDTRCGVTARAMNPSSAGVIYSMGKDGSGYTILHSLHYPIARFAEW